MCLLGTYQINGIWVCAVVQQVAHDIEVAIVGCPYEWGLLHLYAVQCKGTTCMGEIMGKAYALPFSARRDVLCL